MARAGIEKDSKYPNIWRIRYEDGDLSDMYNKTWAKEHLRRYLESNRESKKPKDRR